MTTAKVDPRPARPRGWTRRAWAANLRRVAALCERDHPGRAASLRAEAAAVEADATPGGWLVGYEFRPYDRQTREAFAGSGPGGVRNPGEIRN